MIIIVILVARMEESRSAFKILTGKSTGKRPLERPRPRWEDNIRMYLEECTISHGVSNVFIVFLILLIFLVAVF